MTNSKNLLFLFSFVLLVGCGSEDPSIKNLIRRSEDLLFCNEKLTSSPFADGDGSVEAPFRICTVEQYNRISEKIIEDSSYNTKSYAIYADLDFQAGQIEMIGDTVVGFNGTLDGRNYTLSNISLNVTTDYTGVFRRIGVDGVVKNITIKDASITAKNYTGILAGFSSGKLETVKSTGTVVGTVNVGGLIGRLWASDTTKGVFSSSSAANVTGTGSWIGGLVGWERNGTIEDSFATGNVRGGDRIGGILGVGDTGVAIKRSYATGNVTATGAVGLTGGLVGGIAGTIESSYATGEVASPSSGYAGGITGSLQGSLTKSFSTSRISTGVYVNGGLVGYLYSGSSLSNCYFTGEISSASDYVGGLVGYNEGSPVTFSYVASSSIVSTNPGGLQGGTELAASHSSFWDAELSGITGDFIDDYVTKVSTYGLSTNAMKTKSTYINAGYTETVWNISDGSYPTLKD